jgi:hypothetical protein
MTVHNGYTCMLTVTSGGITYRPVHALLLLVLAVASLS